MDEKSKEGVDSSVLIYSAGNQVNKESQSHLERKLTGFCVWGEGGVSEKNAVGFWIKMQWMAVGSLGNQECWLSTPKLSIAGEM